MSKTLTTSVTGMSVAHFDMIGLGPLVFGKPVHEEARDDETPEQREQRLFIQKAHINEHGIAYIPAAAVKKSLEWAASWLNMKLPGGAGGKATYTKRFKAGIMMNHPEFVLSKNGKEVSADDLETLRLFVMSGCTSGGRVWRNWPILRGEWHATASFILTDESISPEVLEKHARCGGLHDGIGSLRIGRGGPNGMWKMENLQVEPFEM